MAFSLGRERVHFVNDARSLQDHGAGDLKTLRGEFVDGVLWRMPENIVVAVSEVDEVGASNAAAHKGEMVVGYFVEAGEKMRLISQALGRLADHVFEPRS